jgi:hypothetical protein
MFQLKILGWERCRFVLFLGGLGSMNQWIHCIVTLKNSSSVKVHAPSYIINNFKKQSIKILGFSWVPVVHIYNPSYLGGWDQENSGLRPAWANRLWDPSPISKITREKWTGVVAYLLCECEVLSLKPNSTKEKKKKILGF